MKSQRKKKLFLIVLLCLLTLAGFGTKTVQLLNDKPPLINLDEAIQEAKYGKNGNEAHQDGEDPDKDSEKIGNTITVTVHGEGVWLEAHRFFSLDSLKTRLIANYNIGDTIKLVDDYAEAHFYREILSILERLNTENGIVYFED